MAEEPSAFGEQVRALRDAVDEALRADRPDRIDALLAALEALRHLREQLTAWEPELIAAAREAGASWTQLAPALGVASRQAAERRYLRLQPTDRPDSTGEQRVRAERDRRAGDRAVNTWARENAAALRRLAGQVSTLEGLSRSGRQQIDRVERALAGDDAAGLLPELTRAAEHLGADNSGLAEQIDDIARETDALRERTVHDRRAGKPEG